jgi:arginine N-succinyltransferase
MFVVRQSFQEDVEQITALAVHLDTINLPADRTQIERIVDLSERSFAQAIPPLEREYLLVLEDLDQRRVVGTSMVHAQHGTRRAPHVFFRVVEEERYSVTLDRYFVHQCLRIGYNYDGPTEIGGLVVAPEYRGHPASLGKLISYTRFIFLAMHRGWFRDDLLSELMPPLEADGSSVLWEHLGRRFTGLTYQEADRLSKDNKEFIHALFPDGLIYTSMLPEHVRAVIGRVGEETRGVEKILRRIGFRYANRIDPFDGGPHFVARTDQVTLVHDTRRVRVTAGSGEGGGSELPWCIVAAERERARGFRAVGLRAAAAEGGDAIALGPATCDVLGVEPGQEVWCVKT